MNAKELLFRWSNEQASIGNYEEAVRGYLDYIIGYETTCSFELAHCYFRAARWLQHLGRTEEAISYSKKLLSMDSSWSESWCELAYIAVKQGRLVEAREYCVEALRNPFKPRLFSEADKYASTPAKMLESL